MNELIEIQGQSISLKEYRGQRVITFKDIDTVHQRPDGTARRVFNENRKRFVSGVDFFIRNPSEAAKDYGVIAPNGLKLITESGYLMLVKSFTDDLAWKVQRELVDTYFKLKEEVQSDPVKEPEAVIDANMYLAAARIASQLPDGRLYVINCLRHVVPDIDSGEIPEPVKQETGEITTPVVVGQIPGKSILGAYSKPFNNRMLCNHLTEHHVSTNFLASKIGCSEETIRNWKNGTRLPKEYYRIKLCQALQLPVGYFDNRRRVRAIK